MPVPQATKDLNVLVVEDEPHLAESIARRLQEEGYAVDIAYDGVEGLRLGLTKKYQMIVLDLLLPPKRRAPGPAFTATQ